MERKKLVTVRTLVLMGLYGVKSHDKQQVLEIFYWFFFNIRCMTKVGFNNELRLVLS